MSAIQVLKCGITDLPVEALVNEANESLMEGGRVCTATAIPVPLS